MTRPGNIEFLDADGPVPAEGDEIVDAHRLPRWVAALGAVALLAVAATAVLTHGHSSRSPDASASSTQLRLPPPPRQSDAPEQLPVRYPTAPADALALPGGSAAVSITVAADQLYVLQADRLSEFAARTGALLRSVPLAVGGSRFAPGTDRLLADPAHGRLWIVRTQDGAAVSTLDTATLTDLRTVPVDADIARQTLLDGTLYFSTADGVYAADGTSVHRIHFFAGSVALAADAARHRLLVLEPGTTSVIEAMSTSGQLGTRTVADVTGGNIAVVGSTIFLTGAQPHGAVVRPVDAVTLRPGSDVDLSDQLFPGATIAAVGARSLWLRSAGRNSDVLWCRDESGGPVASWWTLPGTVASGSGAAYVLDAAGYVRTITLFSGCSG